MLLEGSRLGRSASGVAGGGDEDEPGGACAATRLVAVGPLLIPDALLRLEVGGQLVLDEHGQPGAVRAQPFGLEVGLAVRRRHGVPCAEETSVGVHILDFGRNRLEQPAAECGRGVEQVEQEQVEIALED